MLQCRGDRHRRTRYKIRYRQTTCSREIVIKCDIGSRCTTIVFYCNCVFDIVTRTCIAVVVHIDKGITLLNYQNRLWSLTPIPVTSRWFIIRKTCWCLTIGWVDLAIIIVVIIHQTITVTIGSIVHMTIIITICSATLYDIILPIIVTICIQIIRHPVIIGICWIDPVVIIVLVICIIHTIFVTIGTVWCYISCGSLPLDIIYNAIIICINIYKIRITRSVCVGYRIGKCSRIGIICLQCIKKSIISNTAIHHSIMVTIQVSISRLYRIVDAIVIGVKIVLIRYAVTIKITLDRFYAKIIQCIVISVRTWQFIEKNKRNFFVGTCVEGKIVVVPCLILWNLTCLNCRAYLIAVWIK